ncbi:protein unc-45 homolog B-like [Limulus polyphemus]|uniref:Protein unc-45 homolog B n=1 Tax=Limulus polyphemus TaxID=6850 RepID=A0ABM1SYT2_LIMPO|nr:protein unc-45 homolog B-like [Limulus polyphemus]
MANNCPSNQSEIKSSDEKSRAQELKEEGNKLFKAGDHQGAIITYTKALNLCPEKCQERIVCLKNRAAAFLKLGQYENAVKDANAVLEEEPSDVKALFRRSQAYEELGNFNEAFKDALAVQHLEPRNTAIQPVLRRLNIKLQQIAKEQSSTINKVKQMLDILLKPEENIEKKVQATNNLIVLAREKSGAHIIACEKGIEKLVNGLKITKNLELSIAVIRVLGEICRNNVDRTAEVMDQLDVQYLVRCFNTHSSEYLNAVQYLTQLILNSLSGMDIKEGKKPDKNVMKSNQSRIDSVMVALVKSCASHVMSAIGRDSLLELIMKNVDVDALNWGQKFIESEGIWALMEIASELKEIKYESSMDITDTTQANISVIMDRVYWCMDHDKAREVYREKVMEYVNNKLSGPDIENKVRVTAAITALLQGPLDVGNYCLGQQGVMEMMLAMCNSEDEVQQGLCKLGSLGGTDAAIRPFSDGSTQKLAKSCRKLLVNPAKDKDLRKWAAEGLAYLTLDAEVKEALIEDQVSIQALIELAKTGDLSVLYGVVTTLVNLTNSYEKQEMIPEMIELAKFAKQHVPEDHSKDSKEFVDKRVKVLVESGITSALVALSKTESKSSRELIARVFNAMCEQKELRGTVVQQGGAKILLNLALEGTDKGKIFAAQALARIGITINPEVAFPGQRAAEVVRPLMSLLHPDCSALQNFEGLMTITNLAQVSPSVRSRILKDSGFSWIENYMYEEHEMLKRAATQCIVNLVTCDEVIKHYEGDNDRVKYLVLLSEDDDFETAKAASGALAMITSSSTTACKKVLEARSWHEILCKLVASQDKDLQHRGVCIVHNMILADQELAEKIVETNLLEVLMAIVRPEVDDVSEKVKDYARVALKKAEDYKLIMSTEKVRISESKDEE